MPSFKPLRGIKVLDLSRLLPGPFCSYLLQQMGAEVTVIVPPESLEEVLVFSAIQKNKKKIRLNLKNEKDYKKFLQSVKKSDVVLEGFRPGVLKRLEADLHSLKKINQKIILCSLTGYGQKEKEKAGHDLNYLSVSGFLTALVGKEIPLIPGIPLADLCAGIYAAFQIVAALTIPKKSRKSVWIDVSMVEALKLFLTPLKDGMDQKLSSVCSGGLARYHLYETLDHQWVAVAPLEEKFWKQFIDEMKVPPQILQEGEEQIIEWLEKKFKQKKQKEWLSLFHHPDLCVTPVVSQF